MVTKSQKSGAKKGKVKVGSLKLNRETVKNLTPAEKKGVKGKGAALNKVQGQNATIATCCNCSYSGCTGPTA